MIKKIIALTMLSGSLFAMQPDDVPPPPSAEAIAAPTLPGSFHIYPDIDTWFTSISLDTLGTGRGIIAVENARQATFGAPGDGVVITDVLPNHLERIKAGNPWHAVLASTISKEVSAPEGVIMFGQFPTTTYTKPEHAPLHAAFKELDLVMDEIVDSKHVHVAVDGKGLATFVWAFADGVSTERKQQIIEAALRMAKDLAAKEKPLPISGLQARDLFVLAHPSDPIRPIFDALGFFDVVGPWDMLYGKPRIALTYPLTDSFDDVSGVPLSVAEAVLDAAESAAFGEETAPPSLSDVPPSDVGD